MKNDAVPDLAAVREELDRWRASRAPRQPIPDHLWAKAVALLEHHSRTAVCRALRLNSSRLLERAGSAAPPRRRRGRRPPKLLSNAPAKTAFLEVSAAELSDRSGRLAALRRTPVPTLPARAVMERADGARLTLEIPAEAAGLQALCSAFLRA